MKIRLSELRKIIREELARLAEKKDGRVKTRKYKGKTYKGAASMKGKSWEEKVKMAKAAGADDPEAMAAAATIAHKGKPASKD